jgi:hypothetical protein
MAGTFGHHFGLAFGDDAEAGGDQPVLIEETLQFVAALTSDEVFAVLEQIAFSALVDPRSERLGTLLESIGLSDTLTPILEGIVADDVALADVLTADSVRMVAIVDSLLLTGAAAGTLSALAMLADAIALADLVHSVQDGEIADAIVLSDTIAERVELYERLVSGLVFSDTPVGLVTVTAVVPEALVLAGSATGLAELVARIREDVALAVSFVFDDVPYVGIAMNAATKAVTEYPDWQYNSLADFNGELFGAGPQGLYRAASGTTRDGVEIAWRLRGGLRRLAGGRAARIESAYLGLTTQGSVVMKIITVPTKGDAELRGEKVEYWYTLLTNAGSTMHEARVKFGRGMRTIFGSWELAGTGPMQLDVVELHPLQLERRI